jgi:hypothetical protein
VTPALGRVVTERLGLWWDVHQDPYGLGFDGLAGLAVRDNPKRAHLVVSTVLAKHVPVVPSTVRHVGALLAELVQLVLPEGRSLVVVGFCETATALGHTVADGLPGSAYVHTTRRPDASRQTVAGFDEEHSHATAHHLQPDPGILDDDRPMVLVDDELTTGTTALNTIAALDAVTPRDHYVLATLLDLRTDQARSGFSERARAMGIDVQVVALLDGGLDLPDDVLARAAPLQAELKAATDPSPPAGTAEVLVHETTWPAGVLTGARHGFTPADEASFAVAIDDVAAGLELTGPVLVVGVEELMYAPVRLAHALELAGHDVRVQSTTRSPVLPLDVEGYAIRTRLRFPSPDDAGRVSHLYNIRAYGDIVVVTEDPPECSAGLVEALRPWAQRVHLVVLR